MVGTHRDVYPFAIMQMQDGRGGNSSPHLRLLAVESRGDEHPYAHDSWIRDFKAYFCRMQRGIENRQNVIDAAFEHLAGVSVQTDIRIFADVHRIEIIFVDIADDPDKRKIGDSERIGRA